MGMLGVLFDSKLQWVQHVAVAIRKANNALNAIKLIKKYGKKEELRIKKKQTYFCIVLFANIIPTKIWNIFLKKRKQDNFWIRKYSVYFGRST